MREKGYRRHKEAVKKEKCHKLLLERAKQGHNKSSDQVHEEADNKKTIGKMASVHGAECSCYMCGNPRKHFGEKTRQEIIADKKAKEE
jgi:hypothetical protein